MCQRRWPDEPQPSIRYHKEGPDGLIRAYCIMRGREFFSVDLHKTTQLAREDACAKAYALLVEESITLHPSRMPRADRQGEFVGPVRSESDDSLSSTSSVDPYDRTAMRAQASGGRHRQANGRKGA